MQFIAINRIYEIRQNFYYYYFTIKLRIFIIIILQLLNYNERKQYKNFQLKLNAPS